MADINYLTREEWSKAMYYAQQDRQWGSKSFSSSTISESGCGPTSYAMVCQLYGYRITPDQVAEAMGKYYVPKVGLSGQAGLTDPQATGDRFGVYLKHVTNPEEAFEALKQGKPVIASHYTGIFTGGGGHFIVYSYRAENGQVRVMDPGWRGRADITNKTYDWNELVQDNNGKGTGDYEAYIVIGLNPKLPRNNIIVNGQVVGAEFLPKQDQNQNSQTISPADRDPDRFNRTIWPADRERESYKKSEPKANQEENINEINIFQNGIYGFRTPDSHYFQSLKQQSEDMENLAYLNQQQVAINNDSNSYNIALKIGDTLYKTEPYMDDIA